jgi:hypothetical protein
MLFARTDDQEQAVVALQVLFHVEPIQIFQTHRDLSFRQ